MPNLFVKVVYLCTLPLVVFVTGALIMSKLTGRDYVTQRLRQAPPEDQKPLNQRSLGYDVRAVERHWGALDEKARGIEQRFLELDLVFPFVYGAGLAASLLMAWTALGRPFGAAWLLVPVAIAALADWTENLVQLPQLARLTREEALQEGWIRIASSATIVKLLFINVSSLLLLGLVGVLVFRAPKS